MMHLYALYTYIHKKNHKHTHKLSIENHYKLNQQQNSNNNYNKQTKTAPSRVLSTKCVCKWIMNTSKPGAKPTLKSKSVRYTEQIVSRSLPDGVCVCMCVCAPVSHFDRQRAQFSLYIVIIYKIYIDVYVWIRCSTWTGSAIWNECALLKITPKKTHHHHIN